MAIDPKTVDPKQALALLAQAAQRVLPLVEADNYNASVKCLGDIIDDHLARKAIEADKAKLVEPPKG